MNCATWTRLQGDCVFFWYWKACAEVFSTDLHSTSLISHLHTWPSKWPPPQNFNIGVKKETRFRILDSLALNLVRCSIRGREGDIHSQGKKEKCRKEECKDLGELHLKSKLSIFCALSQNDTLLKNSIVKLRNGITISLDWVVLELLNKTIFCTLWSITYCLMEINEWMNEWTQ